MTMLDDRAVPQPVHKTVQPAEPKPLTEGTKRSGEQFALYVFVIVPFLAVLAAIPVGYHRYFTHGGFKARRALRIALAVAGSLAIEGPVIRWVADHRRHHAFSDREGDPHSPWRFGDTLPALTKGLLFAH